MVITTSRRQPWTAWLSMFQRKAEPQARPVKEQRESLVEQVEQLFGHVFALTYKQD